jgi:hypothetical protein
MQGELANEKRGQKSVGSTCCQKGGESSTRQDEDEERSGLVSKLGGWFAIDGEDPILECDNNRVQSRRGQLRGIGGRAGELWTAGHGVDDDDDDDDFGKKFRLFISRAEDGTKERASAQAELGRARMR